MSQFQKAVFAAAVTLAFTGAAQAAPSFAIGDNSVIFQNFENPYRSSALCAAGCLPADAGDPAGFTRINPAIPNNILAGDIFVGILNVRTITSLVSGNDVYNSASGDRFTGYFAQRVDSVVFPDSVDPTKAHITLGTAVDPFGILGPGEMFRLYSNTPSFTSEGADVSVGISAATAGVFWASFGLSADGYSYTHTGAADATAFLALDMIARGQGYNAGTLLKLNDSDENEVGGTIANPASQLCGAAEIASPVISCNDIVGTSVSEPNLAFFVGASPWVFVSNDPFDVNAVPEPGTLALFGLALAGLGASRRRRRTG